LAAFAPSDAVGGSTAQAAADDRQSRTANSAAKYGAPAGNAPWNLQLSLLVLTLILVPLVLWAIVRAVHRREAGPNDDVVYQNLNDARQIYGKIIKN
jgi:hypothetical protein